MQFSIVDPFNPSATPRDIFNRFMAIAAIGTSPDEEDDDELARLESQEADADDDEDEKAEDTSDETDDPNKPEVAEKRRKKLRLARLKRKTKARAYEYTGGTDVVGIVFLEINRITDLPPERNSMLPHVVPRTVVFDVAHHFDSDTNLFRHGPIRCGFVGEENLPNPCDSAQPQPCV